MDFDLGAALRVNAVDVDLGERTYRVPHMDALQWVEFLDQPGLTWGDLVPGLLEDAEDLEYEMFKRDSAVTEDELVAAAREVLTAIAGVKWSIALQLVGLTLRQDIGGELILRKIRPAGMPFGAYLVACYTAGVRNMDRNDRAKFDGLISARPAGVRPEDWYDAAEAADLFMNAMGADGSFADDVIVGDDGPEPDHPIGLGDEPGDELLGVSDGPVDEAVPEAPDRLDRVD